MAESIHDKIAKRAPPRVHIKYEVETAGAIQVKELPFVLGVLGDFTGQPAEPLPRLRERKFVEVTPETFDDVLKSMKPRLSFSVDNALSSEPDAGQLAIDLSFERLDDFSPDRVAEQAEPLRKLLELRHSLADLRGSLQGNDNLEEILQATLADKEALAKLRQETGTEGASDG